MDSAVRFDISYRLDSSLSVGYRYSSFEQWIDMTNPYDQPAGIYVWESTAANTELLGTIYAMSTQGRWGGGGGRVI